jgi:MFS family permease
MHAPTPSAPSSSSAGWWRELTGYHWFVLVVAALGWLFDTMDQQLFNLARGKAVADLMEGSSIGLAPKTVAGLTTMLFMIGWATGGIIFGVLGDRIGRAKTMMLTIVVYSAFTGLSALSKGVWDFCLYRFLTGLGVGGEFAVGVALVAEAMPERARTPALGWLQALSAVGNCTAALISMGLGELASSQVLGEFTPWRMMFVIGTLPAILVLFVMRRLKEPERWKSGAAGERRGSLSELLGTPQFRRNAIVGLLLGFSGVVGLWGIAFFSFDLIRSVLQEHFAGQGLDKAVIEGKVTLWVGIASLLQNFGGFLGILAFSKVTQRIGRRPAFAIAFLLAMGGTAMTFAFLQDFTDILWMTPVLGFCTLTLFGGYAIYFPELFPTRLRSTGVSFCYNIGRYVASVGPLTLGLLADRVYGDLGSVTSWRYAGVTMCSVFLVGLLALPFAPETKGQPLPE